MQVPTIRVAVDPTPENPQGFVVINEADFDENAHILWDEMKPEPPAPAPAKGGKRKGE